MFTSERAVAGGYSVCRRWVRRQTCQVEIHGYEFEMPLLEVYHLTKSYGDTYFPHDISFSVDEGDIIHTKE